MPTILELFKGSENDKAVNSSANESKGGFKQDVKNFVEQELDGVRKKSLVDINNPLIYGSDTLRIAGRTTTSKDKMLDLKTPKPPEGVEGLPEKPKSLNLNKAISSVRDKVNSTLGIPTRQIPSTVYDRITKAGSSWDTSIAVQSEGDVTELGKMLQNAGGTPGTIGKQAIGGGLGIAKDKLRGALFGKGKENLDAIGDDDNFIQKYSNQWTKSQSYKEDKKNGKKIKKDDQKTLETERGMFEKGQDLLNLVEPGVGVRDDGSFMWAGGNYKDLVPFYISRIVSDGVTMFRANITGLSETVSPSWNSHKFLGNPFSFYTYTGVERSVALNLQIYAGSKAELATNWEKITELTRLTYPTINSDGLVNPPITKIRLGNLYKNKPCYIESLSYTMPDNGTWETDDDGMILPKFIDVALTVKFIEDASTLDSEYGIYGYDKSQAAKDAIMEIKTQNRIFQEPIEALPTKGVKPFPTSIPKAENLKLAGPLQNKVGIPPKGIAQPKTVDQLGGKNMLDGLSKLQK